MNYRNWNKELQTRIENAQGEPLQENEYCEVAANALFAYMVDGLGLQPDSRETGTVDMYELYLCLKHLHGTDLLRGSCAGHSN